MVTQILAWADAHQTRTGKWPKIMAGPVFEAAHENWEKIDTALRNGGRGLPGGSSLRSLSEQRGFRPDLTVERILAWANAHRERTGKRPSVCSGPIHGLFGDTWQKIDKALRRGLRGLPGGSSLSKLLNEQRGPRPKAVGRTSAARRALQLQVPS